MQAAVRLRTVYTVFEFTLQDLLQVGLALAGGLACTSSASQAQGPPVPAR